MTWYYPWGGLGQFFFAQNGSRIYPNMWAKFSCGPTVVSKKKGGGGTDRQTKISAALYSRSQSRPPCWLAMSVSIIHAEGPGQGKVNIRSKIWNIVKWLPICLILRPTFQGVQDKKNNQLLLLEKKLWAFESIGVGEFEQVHFLTNSTL